MHSRERESPSRFAAKSHVEIANANPAPNGVTAFIQETWNESNQNPEIGRGPVGARGEA